MIDSDTDSDSDPDLDETMKDMKLHEKREFPPAFQKKPSDAIPCVRGEIIDSDTDSDSDPDLDETMNPETPKPRNPETQKP